MKYLIFFLCLIILACSDDDTTHKRLFFTFKDQFGLDALGTTEIEPETKTIVAVHASGNDPEDVAFNPDNNNVYLSMGQNAEVLVYKIDDLNSSKILFSTQYGIGSIAIDTQHQKLYWVNRNQGTVYVHKLDGTGSSSVLFGGASITAKCTGLAVDPNLNRLYLLDAEAKRILAADLNTGAEPYELVPATAFTIEEPHDFEISQDGKTLYWVDINRIVSTDTGTGESAIFRASAAKHIFLHHATNHIYVSFSKDVSKTEIGGTSTFQRVFRDDEGTVSHLVVR